VAVLTGAACLALTDRGLRGQQPADAIGCPPCKVCVSEPKANTRKVYACKVEEYCLPRCSLLALLRHCCGCDDGPCCELRVRRRLIVKTVPACPTKQCVLREVPCPPPRKE
jgi:hypothetical protein